MDILDKGGILQPGERCRTDRVVILIQGAVAVAVARSWFEHWIGAQGIGVIAVLIRRMASIIESHCQSFRQANLTINAACQVPANSL